MPDQNFRALFQETENMKWDSTARVHERARQRSLRRAGVVSGVVVAGIIFGGVSFAQLNRPTAVVDPPAASPTASASPFPSSRSSGSPTASRPSVTPPSSSPPPSSSSATPRKITAEMLLRPEDVGAGYTTSPAREGDGDWTIEFNLAAASCPAKQRPEVLSARGQILTKGRPQDEQIVLQQVNLYPRGEAARYLDRLRQRVTACRPPAGASVRIAAAGFAGDDSLLVVFDHGGGSVVRSLVVRVGDRVSEVWAKKLSSNAGAVELGKKAAARL